MDREQVRILQANGFMFAAVPGLHPQPRAKYYSVDKNDEHVVEHNLPADPYSLEHYLKRGFTLTRPTEPQAKFACETCGKVVSSRIALIGHKRSHLTKL